jgi:hypothetical protein
MSRIGWTIVIAVIAIWFLVTLLWVFSVWR